MVTCPSCGHTFTAPKKKAEDYTVAFEAFWKAFQTGRRCPNASKPDAFAAWKQVDPPADVILYVGPYLAYIDKAKQFACHPATWLREKRWEGFQAEAPVTPTGIDPSWDKYPATKEALIASLGAQAFTAWLGPCQISKSIPSEEGYAAVTIHAGRPFRRTWIEKNFSRQLHAIFGQFKVIS